MNVTVDLPRINQAMSYISFSQVLLDAALVEIEPSLMLALGGESTADHLSDKDLNRASAASAMALVGALSSLKNASDLEGLMIGVEFLDDEDLDDAKIVKGVMLDRLLAEKVSDAAPFEVEQLKSYRSKVVEILQQYDYAGQYFTARSVS